MVVGISAVIVAVVGIEVVVVEVSIAELVSAWVWVSKVVVVTGSFTETILSVTLVVRVSITEAVLVGAESVSEGIVVEVSVTESVLPGKGTTVRNKTINSIVPNRYNDLRLFISVLLLDLEIFPLALMFLSPFFFYDLKTDARDSEGPRIVSMDI